VGGAVAGLVTKWVRASDGAIFGTPSHSSTRRVATATAALMVGTGPTSVALDGQTFGLQTSSAIALRSCSDERGLGTFAAENGSTDGRSTTIFGRNDTPNL
jgi:hypothetical protein